MIRNNRQTPAQTAVILGSINAVRQISSSFGQSQRSEAPSAESVARPWIALVLAFVYVGLGQRAFALQDFAAANDSAQGAELEEIVVTATKREENIQKVPVSIYALSQKDLVLAGAKNMDDIAALSPGIQFDNQSGYGTGMLTFISIRGVNSDIGASTTGVYIDDTAVQGRLNQFTNFGNSYPVTFDLNRVEVARGPQGTLFGAGAEGGTVRFIFNQPSLQSFSGQVSSEVSQTQYGGLSYETGVAGGGPIIVDELGFRASAWYRKDGGYINTVDPFTGADIDPNANRTESKAARLAVLGSFGGLTVTPSIYYQSKQIHDATGFYGLLSNPDAGEFNDGHILPLPAADSYYLAALNIQEDLGAAKLTSITSYFSRFATTVDDETGEVGTLGATAGLPLGNAGYGNPLGPAWPVSYADGAAEPNQTSQRILTQELRLSSFDPAARLLWVAGLFYSRSTQNEVTNFYDMLAAESDGVVPPTTTLLYEQTVAIDKQVAAFGQLDFRITDALKLTGGVRVANTKYSFETLAGGLFNGGAPPIGTTATSENPVTPKFGLSYQADPDDLYYFSVAKGYRVGGGNSPLPDICPSSAPPTYSSDSLWSYEVGAKNRLFGDRVQIDTSVFHIDWKNIQQEVLLAACGFNYIANTGEATSNGVDMQVEALLTKQFKVDLAASYTNSRYTKDVAVDGVPIVDSGDQVGTAGSPWNITLAGKYDLPLSSTVAGYLRAEEIYHSKNPGPFSYQIPGGINYAPANVPNPATYLLDLRAGVSWGAFDFSLFVNNTLNSHPYLNKGVDSQSSTLVYYTTLTPRMVGLDASYRF
jgi:iron complex outermembrane recepter protein